MGTKMSTKSTATTTSSTVATRPSAWIQIQSTLNTVNHILIGLVGGYITVLAKSLSFKDTAMHAFMTVIGFHVLCAEALMSHYSINPLTKYFSHRAKSRIHGLLQLAGGSMVLLGAVGKMSQTEVHFKTWHSIIGSAAALMCTASLIGGTLNFFQPKFAHKIYPPAEIKYRHNLFGLLTFSLGMGAILFGYRTLFFFKHVDERPTNALTIATGTVYILTMISPVTSLLDKLKYRNKRRKDNN